MITQDDIDAMTATEIELLQIADTIIDRNATPRPKFRTFHGPREETAILFCAKFWRDQAAALAQVLIEERQRATDWMDVGPEGRR